MSNMAPHVSPTWTEEPFFDTKSTKTDRIGQGEGLRGEKKMVKG